LLVSSLQFSFGKKELVVTAVRDMTYWLKLEKQKNIAAMQTLAFASTAHEFRNPLNAIAQSLELLEPTIAEKKYFSVAKNCSNLMQFLVRDILDFSQIEAKSLVLNMEKTDVLEVVRECIGILKFKADQHEIDLLVEYDVSSVPRWVETDAHRLMQIIINLLSNAIKYTRVGYV
jgi:two-component system, OmpR family, sensor kinase